MKAAIKVFKSVKNKDGSYPIKIVLTSNGRKRETIGSTLYDDWDFRVNRPKYSHPDYEELFDLILNIERQSRKIEFKNLTDFDQARSYLLEDNSIFNNDPDFYAFAKTRIDYMRSTNRLGNAQAYESATNELKKFKPYLRYSEITISFISNFIEYKKSQKKIIDDQISDERLVQNSSIRMYIKEIKAIYNSMLLKHELAGKSPFKGVMKDLPVRKRSKNIYLSHEGIEQMKQADFSISFQRAVDLSLLQFYLCGQYLTDIYHLKKDQIHGGRIYFERAKLGDKREEFDVLIVPEAQAIIDKYSTDKGVYVFPWDKDHTKYKTFRNNHLRDLRRACMFLELETYPKNEPIITRSMRHTFATLGKYKGIDPDILRELMGHERDDIDTVYKDTFPEHIRDQAHKKIIYNS